MLEEDQSPIKIDPGDHELVKANRYKEPPKRKLRSRKGLTDKEE